MRNMFVVASILAVVTVGAMAQADRPDPRAGEYRAWMQSIPPAVRSLTANINGKMGDMAAADADKLDDTFKQIEDFWGQRNVQDAVAFTQTARKALTAISKDAKAGNTDAALADLKTLQSTCGGCHMAHRNGSAGSFSIK
jgi:cytochrome c556